MKTCFCTPVPLAVTFMTSYLSYWLKIHSFLKQTTQIAGYETTPSEMSKSRKAILTLYTEHVDFMYSQPRLTWTPLISHVCLICHYPLATPHWRPTVNTSLSQIPLWINGRNSLHFWVQLGHTFLFVGLHHRKLPLSNCLQIQTRSSVWTFTADSCKKLHIRNLYYMTICFTIPLFIYIFPHRLSENFQLA